MSKILVGLSLYDRLDPAPPIGISRQLALIKEIWLAYATWIFGKTFYYSVFGAGSLCTYLTLGISRFLLIRNLQEKNLIAGQSWKFYKITFFSCYLVK